jgi:tRNA (Thr-GGU) A37 N-methylase
VGIFAQRGEGRPNCLGSSTCELIAYEGTRVRLSGRDAIDGTPVLDIKPYLRGFGRAARSASPAARRRSWPDF